jgi:ATP-dependent DNA helicase RecQ
MKTAHPGPWRDLLADLIDDWRAELGGVPRDTSNGPTADADGAPIAEPAPHVDSLAAPASEIAEFCWETLAEQRRERTLGNGMLLATLHAAKGLEFPHVLIADGGWNRAAPDSNSTNAEDERRIYYVGMTRARQTLTLLEIAGGHHPHLPILRATVPDGSTFSSPGAPTTAHRDNWLLCDRPIIQPPPAEVIQRRYCRLTLADLDIGYAGRQPADAPIHRHLAELHAGDELDWRTEADQLLLITSNGDPVARLSRRAANHWLPHADRIRRICVVALLHRNRNRTEPEYAAALRCDTWEVPMIEICWLAP